MGTVQTSAIAGAFRVLGLAVALLFMSFVTFTAIASAQQVPTPLASQTLSEDDVRGLLGMLRDDAQRNAFATQLETLLDAQAQVGAPDHSVIQRLTLGLSGAVEQLSRRTVTGVDAVLNIRRLLQQSVDLVADPAIRARWTEITVKLLIVLGLAAIAFIAARGIVGKPRLRLADRRPSDVLAKAITLAMRMLLDIGPIVAFVIVAYIVLPITEPLPFTRIVAISAINVTIAIQLVLLVARAIFTPYTPHLRSVPIADETAAYAYVWVRRLSYLGGYVFVVSGALGLLGFSEIGTVVADSGGFILMLMLLVVILQNRAAVRRSLRGRSGASRALLRTVRRQLAEVWHVLAVLYVVGVFLVWALRIPGGFGFVMRGTILTLVIVAIAFLLISIVSKLVEHGFSVGGRLQEQYPSLQRRANRYLPVLRSVTVIAIMIIATLAVLQAWRVPVGTWLVSDFGGTIFSGAATIVVVLLVATLLWELVSSSIERYLEMTDDDGEVVERTARERTLLPLLRNAILVVLIVVVGLIVLSEIGINIAPLLAAAGVVGIAIGFGSQKLVQDVINGLFILFEDTISVGDVVEVAGHSGAVESLSVRNLTLRDLEGHVHTVPFGEVATIRNMSKGFSYALLEVGIAYRENVAEVIEVLKQIGAELEVDPAVGPMILEPIEILGLDKFGDSAIVIKARMKTLAVKQWSVRRAFNLRMKERFDALGIEIPFPHMTLYFGEDKAGHAPPLHLADARPPAKQSKPATATAAIGDEASNVPAPADD